MNSACLSAKKQVGVEKLKAQELHVGPMFLTEFDDFAVLFDQVTVLGINSLYGKVVSFLLKQSPIANRLVLYDEGDTSVAHDIAVIPTTCKVVVYNGEEQLRCAVKNSDVILIGDKDDCITNDNEVIRRKAAEIVRYAQAISTMAPNAIVLIAATPVNSLLPVFNEAQIGFGTFDSDKVMGVTSADTMRASTLLARHMGIDPEKAYLPVIGGSSADTRIPLFSQSRPIMRGNKDDLRDLTRGVKMTEDDLKGMLNRGEALNKAYASVQLIDSVMSALHGQRNISEIVFARTCLVPNVDYFSLPVILGPRGIAHRFPLPTLTERESILLDHAIKHIEIDKMKGINAISGESTCIQSPDISEKYIELVDCYDKDFIRSLMEKLKIRGDCPEVSKPRVEYKLLSKVKLKLPPESKPSEVPERTEFIEPNTSIDDGCCPLKLPCPPISPIRGLNQIHVKQTCRSASKSKACKCFFPPVEKALVPCNSCRSNKPCVGYEEFKSFYEEHRHCCQPISAADEENSRSSTIAIAGTHQITSGQHESTESYPTAIDCSRTSQQEMAHFSSTTNNESIFHAVWKYPKSGEEEPETMPTSGKLIPQASTNITLQGHRYETHSNPEQINLPRSRDCANTESANQVNLKNQSTQPGETTLQQPDSDWPFKCSTALCLDVLAPKSDLRPPIPQCRVDKNAGGPNQTHAHPSMNPHDVHVHVHTHDQQQQHKIYNYSSGISMKTPQKIMEGINTEFEEKEQAEPVSKTTHDDEHEQGVVGIQNKVHPYFEKGKTHNLPPSERETHNLPPSENLREYCDSLAFSPNHKYYGHSEEIGSNRSVNISYSEPSRLSQQYEQTHDHKDASDRVIMDDRSTKDENIKRRMYATLKVIENVKSESIKPLEERCNKHGFSVNQHFNEESISDMRTSRNSDISENKLKTDLESAVLGGWREKARVINANMELQKDGRTRIDESVRKKRSERMGIEGLIDLINPTRRQSRPTLRKSYQALRKMYGRPTQLECGGTLVTMPATEEKSLVVLNDSKEPKRLTRRIDRIKQRIQEALKKIIYPSFTSSGVEPALRHMKQNNLSQNIVSRPAVRRSSK